MKKYIYSSVLFFIYGIITALINVFTIELIFNVKIYSFFYDIIFTMLVIIPIIGFIILLLKLLQYLKKNVEDWKIYQSMIIVLIALGFTILPYCIF